MDELERLLQQARAALARGADSAVVNQRFAEVTGGRASTLADAERLLGQARAALDRGADSTAVNQRFAELTRGAALAPRPEQQPREQEGRIAQGLRGAGRDLAAIADAALLGFPSALTGALEELGLFSEGTREEFEEDIEAATPGTGLLGAFAPVATGFGGVTAASRVPAISRTASQAAVRRAGAGPELLRGARGAASSAVRAAPVPAAEGALIGAGGAEEGEDPLLEALEIGLLSGVTGGAAGGSLRGLGGLLGVLRRPGRRAERVRTAFGDVSRDVPGRRAVEAELRTIDEARRIAFREAEQAAVPNQITDVVRTNPAARRALERSGSQEAKEIAQNFRAVEAAQGQPGISEARRLIRGGEFDFGTAPLLFGARFPGRRARGRAPGAAPEPRPVDFQVAQDIRNDLNRTAEAFQRRKPDASGRVPSNAAAREAREAVELLDEQLSEVPGFRPGMRLTAEGGEVRRALKDGRKAIELPAERVEDHLNGTQRIEGLSVPKSLEGQTAFRRTMLEPLQQKLGGSEGEALSAMNEIRTSPELRGKLRLAIGPENTDALARFVEREARFQTTEKAAKEVAKILSFFVLGSSLGGGIVFGLGSLE